MSELGGMLGNLTPVTANPEEDAAAVRVVLRRVDTGQLDRAGAREILEVLGLVEPVPELLPPAPSPRPAQVLERDPSNQRFRSPAAAGDRLTHPDPPVTHETRSETSTGAGTGHQGTGGVA